MYGDLRNCQLNINQIIKLIKLFKNEYIKLPKTNCKKYPSADADFSLDMPCDPCLQRNKRA